MISQVRNFVRVSKFLTNHNLIHQNQCPIRSKITTPTGQILPEPKRPRFAFLKVILAVGIGLYIGQTISKNIANFLEENELFVPADDDDDDD